MCVCAFVFLFILFLFLFLFLFCFVETMDNGGNNMDNGLDLAHHGYVLDRTMIALPTIGSGAAPAQPITPIGSTQIVVQLSNLINKI